MNSPSSRSSPSFKNLHIKNKQSPIEIKEKLRKSYRQKVHNCRNLLLNSFRGVEIENEVRNTLNDIYNSVCNSDDELSTDEEGLLTEIREELVKEELNWWLEEYDKCQNDNIDWNLIEDDSVICPVCEKTNFTSERNEISCCHCQIMIKTDKNLSQIKRIILNSVEKHYATCNNTVQFTAIPDIHGTHIYIICSICNYMETVI